MSSRALKAFVYDGEAYTYKDTFLISGAPQDSDWTR